MEQELQNLVDELSSAIDEAIAGSDRISAIVHEMERAGYDLTLVLEATMRLSPKDKRAEDFEEAEFACEMPALETAGKFELTPEDQEFLQGLKVAV